MDQLPSHFEANSVLAMRVSLRVEEFGLQLLDPRLSNSPHEPSSRKRSWSRRRSPSVLSCVRSLAFGHSVQLPLLDVRRVSGRFHRSCGKYRRTGRWFDWSPSLLRVRHDSAAGCADPALHVTFTISAGRKFVAKLRHHVRGYVEFRWCAMK